MVKLTTKYKAPIVVKLVTIVTREPLDSRKEPDSRDELNKVFLATGASLHPNAIEFTVIGSDHNWLLLPLDIIKVCFMRDVSLPDGETIDDFDSQEFLENLKASHEDTMDQQTTNHNAAAHMDVSSAGKV